PEEAAARAVRIASAETDDQTGRVYGSPRLPHLASDRASGSLPLVPMAGAHDDRRHQALAAEAHLAVRVAELGRALLELEDDGVAPGAGLEGADLAIHPDRLRRGRGHFRDCGVQRHAEMQELADGRGEVVDGAVYVVDVQIAGDRLRLDPLLQSA